MIEHLRIAKEQEKEMYALLPTKTESAVLGYFKAQDELEEAKESIEEVLKQFRDFVEEADMLFNDDKSRQMLEWLLLASLKLEDY